MRRVILLAVMSFSLLGTCIFVDAPPLFGAGDAKLTILSVAAVPRGSSFGHSGANFTYPEVEAIDIRVVVRLDAPGERKVSVFAAAKDQDGMRMGKAKVSRVIPPGDTVFLFENFTLPKFFYGRHDVSLEVEISCPGADTVKTRRKFTFTGLPRPKVVFDYTDLRPRESPLYIEFLPGESFDLDVFFRIEENVGELDLVLKVYAVMDDQDFEVEDAGSFDPFWDELDVDSEPGSYHIEIRGTLPERFESYYRDRHFFRLIVVLVFDDEVAFEEQIEGLIIDSSSGVRSEPDFIDETYAELAGSERWRVQKLDRAVYNKRIKLIKQLKRGRRHSIYYHEYH